MGLVVFDILGSIGLGLLYGGGFILMLLAVSTLASFIENKRNK